MVRAIEAGDALAWDLPAEAAVAFLFGFFRRDYGAAGLYDLQKSTVPMTVHQLIGGGRHADALPAMRRAIPGHAEGARHASATLWISGGVLVTAFTVGWLTHQALLLVPGVLP
jgi:ferrous iron transport protein B